MARRSPAERNQWATWSRMRGRGPAKIDLCKINTDAFRHMTADQLQLAHTRTGWGLLKKAAIAKAERASTWRKVPRQGDEINALLGRYIAALREVKSPLHLSDDGIEEFWRRYPELQKDRPAPEINKAIHALKKERDPERQAERIEQQIWELQARASCPIKPGESVARDAAREGKHDAAALIRRKKPIIR